MTGLGAFIDFARALMRLPLPEPDPEMATLRRRRDTARANHKPVEIHNRAIKALMESRLAAVVAAKKGA
jgi:hypothetical protein